jgi:hypothetical protein
MQRGLVHAPIGNQQGARGHPHSLLNGEDDDLIVT